MPVPRTSDARHSPVGLRLSSEGALAPRGLADHPPLAHIGIANDALPVGALEHMILAPHPRKDILKKRDNLFGGNVQGGLADRPFKNLLLGQHR